MKPTCLVIAGFALGVLSAGCSADGKLSKSDETKLDNVMSHPMNGRRIGQGKSPNQEKKPASPAMGSGSPNSTGQ